MPRSTKAAAAVAAALLLGLAIAAVASGDNLFNNTVSASPNAIGGVVKLSSGELTTGPINYWVDATGTNPVCDASDGSSATVTINTPTGVTANPPTLTFSNCGSSTQNTQAVTFTITDPAGCYDIPAASVADSSGTYNANATAFKIQGADCTNGGTGGGTVDSTDPDVSYTLSPAANSDGWNNSDVTITWTITDDTAVDPTTITGCGTLSSSSGAPGSYVYTDTLSTESIKNGDGTFTGYAPTCSAQDTSGNSGSGTVDPQILLDKTDPIVSFTGIADGGSYTTGSVPTPGCDTTDALSGVKTAATLSGPTGLNGNGVGVASVDCTGALDVADNTGSASGSYTVNYGVTGGNGGCGILQPIQCGELNLFSRGKSVPTKFRLTGDEPNGFNTSGWQVYKASTACIVDSTPATDTASQTTSNASTYIRYDSSADQYIWNADFRSDPVGSCWRMKVVLDDPNHTTLYSAVFKLQK